MLRALTRRLLKLLLWLMLTSALLVLALRWVPPPGTALMIERKIESWGSGQSLELKRQWRPWNELPDHLKMAVIAAEDQKFAEHWGFDMGAIQAALAHNQSGGSLRGASTLSQQVAKNLFLWSGRSWLRKGLEAWFTALIELLWSRSASSRSTSTASSGAMASSAPKPPHSIISASVHRTSTVGRPANWRRYCPTRCAGARDTRMAT